jgi:hypothetical protein
MFVIVIEICQRMRFSYLGLFTARSRHQCLVFCFMRGWNGGLSSSCLEGSILRWVHVIPFFHIGTSIATPSQA